MQENSLKLNQYDMCFDKAIHNWDEALPLGNGKMGCLIYGDGPIRFALDRVDLWDTRPHPHTQEKGFCYDNMMALAKSGKREDWQEYLRLFDVISSDKAYPSKLTAGRMELDFGIKTEDIHSHVDLRTAVATVTLQEEKKNKIEAFASATEFVGVARIYGDYELHLHIPTYISGDESGTCANNSGIGAVDVDACLHYPKTQEKVEGDFTYYRQQSLSDFAYGVVVYKKCFDDYSELYYTVVTNQDSDEDMILVGKRQLEKAAALGYESLKERHIEWWKQYWEKSSISIGDRLLEKTYYRSYYLFASCSRKGFYPMPLQGVWTADNDSLPPWKGDYHHDTNTQLSYQSFLKANRLEEGCVFIDYLWSMKPKFEHFAEEFFGVKGLLLPSCSTLDGKPIGGWPQYSFSPTMTIWAAQSFDEYYLYTGDKQFLKQRAYPFLKEVEAAIRQLLEEREGKLYLPLSSSPEIYDAKPQAYLKPNSNFDLALLRYLYQTLIGYAEALGKETEQKKYAEILNKLDDIAVSGDGVVMLDSTQTLRESHRHFSHLMCLYPLHLINYDTDEHKRIYEASLLDVELYGTGMWVGFSFAMSAQIYAMAYKGNAAFERLRQFANGFVAENGFHLNGDFKNYGYTTFHYRPFTLESSFGFCDALQEMLLQEHQGYIHLFPAIPDDWKEREVSFEKLRSYGGVLISAKKKGNDVSATVYVDKPTTIRVKNVFHSEKVRVTGKTQVRILQDKQGFFEIELESGEAFIQASYEHQER